MTNYKTLTLTIIGLTLFFCVAAQSDCQSKNNKEKINKNMNVNNSIGGGKPPDEKIAPPVEASIKILGEGANSKIQTPFIFAARSKETYAQISEFAENLPPASQLDFNKSAVVAAFAGTKNTGGYSVEIKKAAGKISINLISPPPDAMTTQALTSPYKIVLIPLEAEDSLWLEAAENWQNAAQNYKIVSGEFEYSGGITGRAKTFFVEGNIKILNYGNNATFIFNLSGKDTEKARKLNETASGKISAGKVQLPRLGAGSFAEGPKPPLKVTGTLENNRLNLTFEPLPTIIADGFQVRGKIEADKP